MKRTNARGSLAALASVVTVALTAAAFWLSYEHLHDIAKANGLDGSRAWAWPATIDLFIVVGEVLILRAILRGGTDPWAIALAGIGSFASIALNVAGVGSGAQALEYVVAAVPPTAALIAFGALMRQVHEALATAVVTETDTTAEPERDHFAELAAAQVARKYGDPVVMRKAPEVVPAGVDLLPIVSATVPTEVTLEREDTEPEPAVIQTVTEPQWQPLTWPPAGALGDHAPRRELTGSLALADARQVVTVPVAISPSELRQRARKLNREVVAETKKPVTIERLREEFNLSRRDATDLRREVVEGKRS